MQDFASYCRKHLILSYLIRLFFSKRFDRLSNKQLFISSWFISIGKICKGIKTSNFADIKDAHFIGKNIWCISFFFQAIQGTTIVVIHPGSSNLHIGRATDHFAQSIPHAIATRIGERFLKKEQKQNQFYRKGISVRLAFLWFCGAEFGN